MKRIFGLAVAVLLTTSLLSAASAAPAATAKDAKPERGLKNAKKVALGVHERDKKMRELKKQAYAKRQQALLRAHH